MTPRPEKRVLRFHRYGTALLGLGAGQGALAAVHARALGPWGVGLLLWSALAFAAVGAAYLLPAVGPRVFGKRAGDGTLPPGRTLLLLPYLLATWGLWEARTRLQGRENPSDEVAPGLFLGRRPRNPSELPHGVALVADLTAEFAAPRSIARGAARYRCLPILDADAPADPAAFRALVGEVRRTLASGKTVYVHCALGRGRSALAAAAVVRSLRTGEGAPPTAADILTRVRSVRRGVRLSAEQMCLLERMCRECQQEPPS